MGYGLVGDIIVGMVGAVIGGFLAGALLNMPNAVNGINVASIVVAFIGTRSVYTMAIERRGLRTTSCRIDMRVR